MSYLERQRTAYSDWPFFGSLIHRVLEELFSADPVGQPTWEWLQRRFEDRLAASFAFLTRSSVTDFRQRGLLILERFWRDHRPRADLEYLTEVRFRAQIGGFDFAGIIDRVDLVPGAPRIVDYKSGGAPGGAPNFRQLEIYALAARQALNLPAADVAYHYLYDGIVSERGPTDSQLSEATEWVGRLGTGITGAEFPPRTGPHCPNCDFFRVCEPGKEWVAQHRS